MSIFDHGNFNFNRNFYSPISGMQQQEPKLPSTIVV